MKFQSPSLPKIPPKRFGELAGFFAIAFLIRFIGSHWGLANGLHNQTFHPDEEVNWRYAQLINPARFQFTPGFYNYGTFYLTLLKIASDMTAAYTGAPHGSQDWAFISRAIYSGRILSILGGSWLVLIAWLAGERIGNKWTGRIAALAIMVSPGLVVHSRFATVDMLAATLVAASGYYALKIVTIADSEEELWLKWTALGGIFAGLSAGTKYTGILGLLMVWTALAFTCRDRIWKGVAVSFLSAIVSFLIVTPGAILDSKRFISDLSYEAVHEASGHGLVFVGTTPGFIYQIGNLTLGMGLLLAFIGLIYLIYCGYKKQRWAVVLLAFVIPTYLLIGKSQVKFYRYSIPLSFPIAIAFGQLVVDGYDSQKFRKLAIPIAAISLVGLDGGALISTVRFTASMIGPDPRDQAARYIKSVSNSSTTVGVIEDPWFWTPPLYPNTGLVRMIPFSVRNQFRIDSKDPIVEQFVPDNPDQRIAWDTRLILTDHPEYITYSDFECLNLQRISAEMNAGEKFSSDVEAQVMQFRAFQTLLKQDYVLLTTYGPHLTIVEDMRYVVPTVYLWKLK